MRLNLIFFIMDLFTLLVYPIVFVNSKIRQFSKSKKGITRVDLLVATPVTTGTQPYGKLFQMDVCEQVEGRS